MTDVHTSGQRSYNMSRIRGVDTKPEMRVRRFLHGLGFRYRLHVSKLPGKPDLVFAGAGAVLFVHGCFWHMHRCRLGKPVPATNAGFWAEKLRSNVERDRRNRAALRKAGWRVFEIWECQTRDAEKLAARLGPLVQYLGAVSVEKQFAGFLARYTPEIAHCARQILRKIRDRLSGAIELVYDNYNALVILFGATERTSDAIFSIALYPRRVTLFFLQGAALKDSEKLLKGGGRIVRHIVLKNADDLDLPGIGTLIDQAIERAGIRFESGPCRMIVKSISPKQRPRRPVTVQSPAVR